MTLISCRYCDSQHGDLLLCEPAKRILDALYARGQRFDMPTIEFPKPINHADMFGGGTVVVAQLVAKAATVLVAGTPRPVLILTGQDMDGNVLPQWLYPGEGPDLERFSRLVADMTSLAIQTARKQAREAS